MTLAPRSEAEVGSRIGRYRLIERIGGGVMTLVYTAHDEALDQRVALKFIAADLQDEPETRERFYREARITAALRHRNIVSVLDVGEDHGRPFIVMELLDGLSLSEYIGTKTPIDLHIVLDLIIQLHEGLQAAHEKGAVHRDVKPSNCFVQADGVLKILDFGLARLHASTLTAGGTVMGTPAFMSPEQAEGRQVDARSDLFSAAAVSYFMLAGRAPFAAPDLPRLLHALLHDAPPPITERRVPDELRDLLLKGLSKSPDDRYPHCAEVLTDLHDVRRRIAGLAGMVGL